MIKFDMLWKNKNENNEMIPLKIRFINYIMVLND